MATAFNCSNEPQPRVLTVGVIDYYGQHYVFPVQFILGVVGNSINLLVLLSSGMKNQANTLLSVMAFADLGFLFCLLPHSLASFQFFYESVYFSYFFFLTKTHAVALANMFSTAATFLVLAVSLERFTGVRKPIHSRFQLRDGRIICLIIGVFFLSFLLSFYHHVEYKVTIVIGCRSVWAKFKHISKIRKGFDFLVLYVHYAKYIQSIVGVIIPVIVVALLNVSLICILRRREILPRSITDKSHSDFRYCDIGTAQRQERKVTATVIAIITCFSITHLPTLFPFIWEQFYSYHGMKPKISFNNVIALLNMLLVSGKVLNFVLFCSCSAYFRRRTMIILSAHLCQKRYRKKYSNMVTSAAPQAGINVPYQHSNALLYNAADFHALPSGVSNSVANDNICGLNSAWNQSNGMCHNNSGYNASNNKSSKRSSITFIKTTLSKTMPSNVTPSIITSENSTPTTTAISGVGEKTTLYSTGESVSTILLLPNGKSSFLTIPPAIPSIKAPLL